MSVAVRTVEREGHRWPPLVGRERPRRILRDLLAAAAGGEGRLVLVGGEAGIGKTTLVAAAEQEAAGRGFQILGGACYDLAATPPFGPWRELAADYRPGPGLPPLPAALLGIQGAGRLGQEAIFAEVADVLAAVAVTPLLLVLEDLHWADPASLDLLRFVSRRLASLPLLLVATYRSEEVTRRHPLHHLLPVLVREAGAARIDLRPLPDAAVRDLVAGGFSLAGEDERRLVGYLQAQAEGNPFFVGELLRSLVEEGILRPLGEGWELGELAGRRLPSLLRQVIDLRLARLGEEAREPLAVAAVIGQEVALDLWREAVGSSEEALLAIAERAIEASLLESTRNGTRLRFAHALVRAALYDGLVPPRRRFWHRRLGELLAAAPAPDADAIADHFQQAGDPRAVEWLVQAGERALGSAAWLTAAERFAVAAELIAGDPARRRERGWLLYRSGRLRRFADPGQGLALLDAAAELAVEVDDPVLAAYLVHDRGALRWMRGDLRRGLAEMEAGVAALDALPPGDGLGAAEVTAWVADSVPGGAAARRADRQGAGPNPRRGTLAMMVAAVGRYGAARSLAESYLGEVRGPAPPAVDLLGAVGDAHFGLAQAFTANGQPDEARRAFAAARVAYGATGHAHLLGSTLAMELGETVLPYAADRLAERRRLASETTEALARAAGAWPPDLAPELGTISLLLVEGAWDEAWKLALAGRSAPHVTLRHEAIGCLGLLARFRGEPDLARQQVESLLPDGPATEPGGSLFRRSLPLQRLAADLALDAGDLSLARAWLAAHDRWLAWSGSLPGRAEGQIGWARLHRLGGDLGAARAAGEAALAHAAEPRQPLALLAAHRALGEVETVTGRHAAAGDQLGAGLALADACAAPFERALTLLALAELRLAGGSAGAAGPPLDEAVALCRRLGAAPALARAEALAARRAAPRPGPVEIPFGLSAREVEVLRLVAAGLTNAQVADRLYLSPRTVGHHLNSIYAKLEVSTRAAATRRAAEHGLL